MSFTLKRSRATRRARRPMPRLKRSSPSSRSTDATKPSTWPESWRYPVTPFSITSGRPPALEATTGTSALIASSATSPKLSDELGNRKTSANGRISSMQSWLPRKSTSRSAPSSRTRCSAPAFSGPSPTITSFTGTLFRTSANT